MPPLNWTIFENLSGSQEANFESLCRAVIQRNYGRFGEFLSLANQPGVEFHLRLHSACELGDVGQWFGWQCRWYEVPSGRAIGNTRRDKIAKAITKTEQEVPGLTDWILWTRHPLTKSDQEWFRKIPTQLRLHMRTSADLDGLLAGPAASLRETYFGELAITNEDLKLLHEISVAPIKRRWIPEVHETMAAETTLRDALLEPQQWNDLTDTADLLQIDLRSLSALADIDLTDDQLFIGDVQKAVEFLRRTVDAIHGGDFDVIQRELVEDFSPTKIRADILARKLRAKTQVAALIVSNIHASLRSMLSRIAQLRKSLGSAVTAVVADAGYGKTHLAANLTAPLDGVRPAGVLLLGGALPKLGGIDVLAKKIVLRTSPVKSFEALVDALNEAGRRCNRRLPLVIDALNEAEDPRDWKSEIARVQVIADRYPYVLLACTLRKDFVAETLPEGTPTLELDGFKENVYDAISRYFHYFKIKGDLRTLPVELLNHPLTLRLFCEVTNPRRKHLVGVEAMPLSLTALFDRYVLQAVERIVQLSPKERKLHVSEISTALRAIGLSLWERNSRAIKVAELRKLLNDDTVVWDQSIVRALELEGILLRSPQDGDIDYLSVIYDALAGHLIADALLLEWRSDVAKQLSSKELRDAVEPSRGGHPLGDDIFVSLAGLLPRRTGQQMWKFVDGPLLDRSLILCADLEADLIDTETRGRLATVPSITPALAGHLLSRLYKCRSSESHPLNAEFLDTTLRRLSLADRDATWTEWLRRNAKFASAETAAEEKVWGSSLTRGPADKLKALWISWQLTSTDRALRDFSTRALYWYGRESPSELFELSIASLSTNDPYVSERMVAASYGVCMAFSRYENGFQALLQVFLTALVECMVGTKATQPSSNWRTRRYVRGIFAFAAHYYPSALPSVVPSSGQLDFKGERLPKAVAKIEAKSLGLRDTLEMDFENYTIGRLFDDRRNYDMNHAGHRQAVAHVLAAVRDSGWRESDLPKIDGELSRRNDRGDRPEVERYGKKYCWLGLMRYAGLLEDKGELNPDYDEVDIDPSFPESPPPPPFKLDSWIKRNQELESDELWVTGGLVNLHADQWRKHDIDGHQGPWLLCGGSLSEKSSSRYVFGFLSLILVDQQDADLFREQLLLERHPGNMRLAHHPSDHYTFQGEIPWSSLFACPYEDNTLEDSYVGHLREIAGRSIKFETLIHLYEWESHNSPTNQASSAAIPSKLLAEHAHLAGRPQSFNTVCPDASVATMTFRLDSPLSGWLFYIREDLLTRYAPGKHAFGYAWGERDVRPVSPKSPGWRNFAYQNGTNTWRQLGIDRIL